MTPDVQSIQSLKELLSEAEDKKAVVLSHSNPDGDAIGSAMALGRLLDKLGFETTCAVPNRFPYFLSWMNGVERMMIYKNYPEEVAAKLAEADVIFCVDFNTPSRLEMLAEPLEINTTARKVLIDHHPNPAPGFDIVISEPSTSSTSFLLYGLIERMFGTGIIDYPMAESMFVGMMTDTGNFSFGNLSPELYRALGTLVEKGVDVPRVNSHIYNSFTEGRMRLLGYALDRKMNVVEKHKAAYISLTEAELRRFDFQVGDTEGFVNLPLAVGDMVMSAMFVQTRQFIRISLRSKGDVDVNLFARNYFNGGGHRNAAGGKSFMTMAQTIEHYKAGLDDFFAKNSTQEPSAEE